MMFSRYSTISQVIKTHGKIHPPLIKGIANALFSIYAEGKYADKVVPAILKANPKWGSKDRRFVAENTYEIVRYWRYYWHLAGKEISTELADLEQLVAVRLMSLGFEVPEEFGTTLKPELETAPFEIKQSYPDWLFSRIKSEIGDRAEIEASALNERAKVYLRINQSKISPQKALNELLEQGVEASLSDSTPGCIILDERANLNQLKLIVEGKAEVQDEGSQKIASFLAPKPNSFVVDACAGAGGKTMHLADLMKNQGKIVAMDTEAWKLDNLLFRAKKSSFNCISTQPLPNDSFFAKNALKVEYLLLDVPCSGTGVIKRNPDTKWKLTEDRLEDLRRIQFDILLHYSVLLKKGGRCVYATCSILPSENRLQVDKFLSLNSEFKLIEDHIQWPSMGADGFYMALIKRS